MCTVISNDNRNGSLIFIFGVELEIGKTHSKSWYKRRKRNSNTTQTIAPNSSIEMANSKGIFFPILWNFEREEDVGYVYSFTFIKLGSRIVVALLTTTG